MHCCFPNNHLSAGRRLRSSAPRTPSPRRLMCSGAEPGFVRVFRPLTLGLQEPLHMAGACRMPRPGTACKRAQSLPPCSLQLWRRAVGAVDRARAVRWWGQQPSGANRPHPHARVARPVPASARAVLRCTCNESDQPPHMCCCPGLIFCRHELPRPHAAPGQPRGAAAPAAARPPRLGG